MLNAAPLERNSGMWAAAHLFIRAAVARHFFIYSTDEPIHVTFSRKFRMVSADGPHTNTSQARLWVLIGFVG